MSDSKTDHSIIAHLANELVLAEQETEAAKVRLEVAQQTIAALDLEVESLISELGILSRSVTTSITPLSFYLKDPMLLGRVISYLLEVDRTRYANFTRLVGELEKMTGWGNQETRDLVAAFLLEVHQQETMPAPAPTSDIGTGYTTPEPPFQKVDVSDRYVLRRITSHGSNSPYVYIHLDQNGRHRAVSKLSEAYLFRTKDEADAFVVRHKTLPDILPMPYQQAAEEALGSQSLRTKYVLRSPNTNGIYVYVDRSTTQGTFYPTWDLRQAYLFDTQQQAQTMLATLPQPGFLPVLFSQAMWESGGEVDDSSFMAATKAGRNCWIPQGVILPKAPEVGRGAYTGSDPDMQPPLIAVEGDASDQGLEEMASYRRLPWSEEPPAATAERNPPSEDDIPF